MNPTTPKSQGGNARWRSGDTRLTVLVAIVTLLGLGHHVDHIARGNYVGWPLVPNVTPFTYSLLVYPLIALGFYLWTRRKVGPSYWAVLAGAGFAFVGLTHFGPFAAEPPREIIDVYPSRAIGWAAFGLLVTFLVALAAAATCAGSLRWRERRAPPETGATPRPHRQ